VELGFAVIVGTLRWLSLPSLRDSPSWQRLPSAEALG